MNTLTSNTIHNLRKLEATALTHLADLPPVPVGEPDIYAHKRSALTDEVVSCRAAAFDFAEDHAADPLPAETTLSSR